MDYKISANPDDIFLGFFMFTIFYKNPRDRDHVCVFYNSITGL